MKCSEAAAATRKRLEEAAEAKEAAEKAANAARNERRKHTAGRLTAEVCTRCIWARCWLLVAALQIGFMLMLMSSKGGRHFV